MTLSKFNELYTGVALLINQQAPTNATLLTDDEMRNIKGNWHTEIRLHAVWHHPWIQWVPYKIHINVWIPYITLRWVSIYDWGPIHIGYFLPQIRFYHLQYSRWIKIPIYHRGYWTYYTTTKRVPDPWDIKPRKALEIGAKIGGITVASFTCAAAVATIIGTDGFSVPFAGPVAVGSATTATCTAGLVYCDLTDSATYNPDPNPSGKGEGVLPPLY